MKNNHFMVKKLPVNQSKIQLYILKEVKFEHESEKQRIHANFAKFYDRKIEILIAKNLTRTPVDAIKNP